MKSEEIHIPHIDGPKPDYWFAQGVGDVVSFSTVQQTTLGPKAIMRVCYVDRGLDKYLLVTDFTLN